jgi:hypothetical protein
MARGHPRRICIQDPGGDQREAQSQPRSVPEKVQRSRVSIPLKDFRLGIPESVDVWLESEAQAFDTDKAHVAREVLMEWARKKAHAHKVASRLMASKGMQTELDWQITDYVKGPQRT